MDKDDNLFEDEIKESSDLLDITIDDLTDEAIGEEADEGVIDLTDLLEKGDSELFGEDEILKDDIKLTDDLTGFPEDLMETKEKGGLDDILADADISAPADDFGLNLTEEVPDELLPDDSVNASSDIDLTGDAIDKLLNDTVLDELSKDSEALPDDADEFNLESEDFSDLEIVLEEDNISTEKIAVSTIASGVQGNLFSGFDTGTSAPEETGGLDDKLITEPDIFSDAQEKNITPSDDVTNEKSFWGTEADENTSGPEAEEGISILEEAPSDDEKIEYSPIDSENTGFVNIDDIQLDSKSVDELFSDDGIISEPKPDIFKQDVNQVLQPSVTEEPEIAPPPESPVVTEIPVTDEAKPAHEIISAQPEPIVQPVISEQKIEEIVTKVVGEVVERVAREVFKEVAEKVISEAIEGLKKSLEAELE